MKQSCEQSHKKIKTRLVGDHTGVHRGHIHYAVVCSVVCDIMRGVGSCYVGRGAVGEARLSAKLYTNKNTSCWLS